VFGIKKQKIIQEGNVGPNRSLIIDLGFRGCGYWFGQSRNSSL